MPSQLRDLRRHLERPQWTPFVRSRIFSTDLGLFVRSVQGIIEGVSPPRAPSSPLDPKHGTTAYERPLLGSNPRRQRGAATTCACRGRLARRPSHLETPAHQARA